MQRGSCQLCGLCWGDGRQKKMKENSLTSVTKFLKYVLVFRTLKMILQTITLSILMWYIVHRMLWNIPNREGLGVNVVF